MNISKVKLYILEIIVTLVLSIFLFFKLNNKIMISIFLIIYSIITKKSIESNKTISIHNKEVFKYMFLFAIGYLALYYIIGIYVGFYQSVYKFNIYTITHQIIPIIIIIITSEIIRKEFLSNDSKISIFLSFLFGILIDFVIFMNIDAFSSLENILEVFGTVFFASITSNLLYIYVNKYYGIKPNIIYRLITILYLYIIPITPDVYMFFQAFYRMIYPLIIYLLLDSTYSKTKKTSIIRNEKYNIVISCFSTVIMISLIMLISCKFTYGILVIGSNSMKNSINKGDAIVYNSKATVNDINIGDVIVFYHNSQRIVHRVVKIDKLNNNIIFYTKGDNNLQEDSNYVSKDNLVGKVNFKITKIGLPTVWINELFKSLKGV